MMVPRHSAVLPIPLATLAAVAVLAGCAVPAEPAAFGPEDVRVEVDAYSGRPNPTFELSSAEAAELAVRLRDLSPAPASTVPADGLGYRGFRIRNPGGEGGVPVDVYVSRSSVILVGSGEPADAIYLDRHGLERWLRGLAESRGYGEALPR